MLDLPPQPGSTPPVAQEFRSAPVTETPRSLIEKIGKKFPKVRDKLKTVEEKFTGVSDKFQTSLGLVEIGIGRSMRMAKKETGPFDEKDNEKEVMTTALELTDDGYNRIFRHSAEYFKSLINQAILNYDGGLMADLLIRNVFTVDELKSLAQKYKNTEAIDFLENI